MLDEINLANQSTLEGLNALLDHRQEVYVAEIDQTVKTHPDFRLFAAQNPVHEGGGRKGLPRSFLNRFTKLVLTEMRRENVLAICRAKLLDGEVLELLDEEFGHDPVARRDAKNEILNQLKASVELVYNMADLARRTGFEGFSDWDWNLRDALRLVELLKKRCPVQRSGSLLGISWSIFGAENFVVQGGYVVWGPAGGAAV